MAEERTQSIENSAVPISTRGDPSFIIDVEIKDSSGQTPELTLPTPPLEYSMAPSEYQPYAEYTFRISKEGYEDLEISGAEILPNVTATQQAFLRPAVPGQPFQDIVIPAHTLFGNYPEKIPEDEIKPMETSGEIDLSRVVIPETIVVHYGTPDNTSALT